MKRIGLSALLVAAIGCSPATNLLPADDLNRPTDVAFMCIGAFPVGPGTGTDGGASGQPLQVSGRPMRACHPPDGYDPGATTTTRTFAFLPNSASGTLSVVDADHWKLLDLGPQTAGYGTAPLGQLPGEISASDDGCRIVSANRGSCDLTVVDPSVLVAPSFTALGDTVSAPSPRTGSQTFRPLRGDGTPLVSAPYEAVYLPEDTSSLVSEPPPGSTLPLLPQAGALCGDSAAVDPVGWGAQPAPKSWYVLVTYPSCDLIAVVALPSGRIVSSAYVRPGVDGQGQKTVTLVDAGTSPVCPIDCAGQAISPQTLVDAAPVDGAPAIAAPSADAASIDAAASDAGARGPVDASGAAGAGGMGAGGATSSSGRDGSAADAGDGATGGTPGGALLGNQFPDTPYLGAGSFGPSGIAIVPDGSRAYVSLANASFIVSVGLSSAGLVLPGHAIYLHGGARGSTRIRLNVDRTRSKVAGVAGVFVGAEKATTTETAAGPNFVGLDPAREYLYVLARDGTIRVVSVFQPGAETECETNADPLNLPAGVSANTACIPVDPAHRRPFSVGPGIHLPSLPIDVAAADIQIPGDDGEQSVNGAHAWVITASGIVYLVNINPVLRKFTAVPASSGYQPAPVTEAPPFVNTLRDRNEVTYSVSLDPSSGPPRVDVLPNVPATGPYIEPFWTQGSALNATALTSSFVQTAVFFPQIPHPLQPDDPIDRRAVTAQTWTVAWEGPMSGIRNTGRAFGEEQGTGSFPSGSSWVPLPNVDAIFQDGGENYCSVGIVPGDLLTLTGCTSNAQCGLDEQCVFSASVSSAAAGLSVTGLCVDPNQSGARQNECAEFLNSVRRYEIEAASPNTLVLRPRLDEIVLSPLEGPCHPAAATGADGGVADAGGADGGSTVGLDTCPDTEDDPSTARFTCESAYPGGGTAPRCLMLCNVDSDCRGGRTCVDFGEGPLGGQVPGSGPHRSFCADAPVLHSADKNRCFDQLLNYQINAGRSFVVTGSQTGIINTAVLPSPNGICAPNPTPDPRFTFRIPMDAPTCTNIDPAIASYDSRVDPDATGGGAAGAGPFAEKGLPPPSPSDPCLFLGGPVAGDPQGSAENAAMGSAHTHVRALFKNAQLSFVLANIDRAPTLQFVTTFDVHGGFAPQPVQQPATVQISMPARIVLGPVDSRAQVTSGTATPLDEAPYLFVVDQRRLGGTEAGGASRGQLLRINPYGYTATVGNAPPGYQPIFEDYNASGGLFPIE